MSDRRRQLNQEDIATYRINYGLRGRTPQGAADWWREQNGGREPAAPAAAVTALGVALEEIERLWAERARAARTKRGRGKR